MGLGSPGCGELAEGWLEPERRRRLGMGSGGKMPREGEGVVAGVDVITLDLE